MKQLLRHLFFCLVVRPVILLLLGVQVRFADRLPSRGPAILVANHNSHLDTAILMCLFPLRLLKWVRPVAAADYWLKNRFIAYFALNIVGIIPISRTAAGAGGDLFAPISQALEQGSIIIFFPEGTRGEPERLGKFKSGIARLAERHPMIPIIPIFLHGAGKALPRGEGLLIPFLCDVFVGDAIFWNGDKHSFLPALEAKFANQAREAGFEDWQ